MIALVFGEDWIWVLLVVMVLFGGSQLPKLAKNAGAAMKEFRKAHDEAEAATSPASPTTMPAALPAPAAVPPAVSPTTAQAVPVTAVSATGEDDRVTLSRGELDALLADREAKARAAAQTGPEAE